MSKTDHGVQVLIGVIGFALALRAIGMPARETVVSAESRASDVGVTR